MPTGLASIGDAIVVRGADWEVIGVTPHEACAILHLEGCGADNAGVRRALVTPFDRPVVRGPCRIARRRRDTVLRAARACVAAARPPGRLWTAAGATIDLMPYQLEPAMAVLGGATRVLLADAVGLGKTIQAALILAELRARGLIAHALVLVPPGLRISWADELHGRFGIDAVVMDRGAIARGAPERPIDANPWAASPVVIASLDFAKRAEVRAAVAEVPWDLLIVDEAHHLTPDSDRGAALAQLAWRVPWVVLASATPHSGDRAAFDFLTRLGRMGDSLVVFRRGRGEVAVGAGRRERLLPVVPTPAERAMIEAAHRYARLIFLGRGAREPGARLVATTLARRAASSPTALAHTLSRRLALLSRTAGVDDTVQQTLPWDEADADDDGVGGPWLASPGLDAADDERRILQDVLELARAAEGGASKIGRLVRLVGRVSEPLLAFSEYRDTVEAVRAALAPHCAVAVIHGGMPAPLRHEAVCRFTGGDAAVLLATDAAGEGLNLHGRCRLVVNLELPWNPLRLEQRVGRVDRLGQSRRVHALHLYHRDTVEDTVLAGLERRRARAGTDLAAREIWVGEDAVARAALGGEALAPARAPRVPGSRVSLAGAEARRLSEARRARSGTTRRTGAAALALPRCVGDAGGGVVVLHDVVFAGRHRRLLARDQVAVVLAHAWRPRDRCAWRRALEAMARDPRVRSCAIDEAARGAARVLADLAPFALAVTRRLRRIAARVEAQPRRARQASLFDRRAERHAALGARLRARLLDHLHDRLDSVRAPAPRDVQVRVQLAAVWSWRAAAMPADRGRS